MRFLVDAARPVLQHDQDRFGFCGRACAQMIIGSFLRELPRVGRSTEVIGQKAVKRLEGGPRDPSKNEAGWFTTPAELAAALNHDRSGLPDRFRGQWRVSHWRSQDDLLADIAMTMKVFGTPAAVTTNDQADHWQVVVEISTSPKRLGVFMHDPLDITTPFPARTGTRHTFNDGCQVDPTLVNGVTALKMVAPTKDAFGNVDFRIDPLPGQANASGFDGRAVGIVFGALPPAAAIERRAVAKQFRSLRRGERGVPISIKKSVADAVQDWQTRLLETFARMDRDNLVELVKPQRLVRVRAVRMLEGSRAYVIAGAFARRRGVLAAYDQRSNGRVLEFQIVTNRKRVESLQRHLSEDLFWTPTVHTPSPLYPCTKREAGGKVFLKRLLDGVEFEWTEKIAR